MKATILSGLIALALGAFTTSCSNILEENGVLNSAAQSGMGELRINLTTDASLNVSTKSGEGEGTQEEGTIDLKTKYDSLISDFLVTITPKEGASVSGLPNNQKYGEIEKTYTLPVEGGPYSLTATYSSMNGAEFAWDAPEFSGTQENIAITANDIVKADAKCELTNSIITIKTDQLTNGNKITVNSLHLTTDEKDSSKDFVVIGENIKEGKSLENNIVFVKAGISPKLVLNAVLHQEGIEDRSFTQVSELKQNASVQAKTQYNVSYSLSNSDGQLGITISINGDPLSTETIDMPVNPYQPATE